MLYSFHDEPNNNKNIWNVTFNIINLVFQPYVTICQVHKQQGTDDKISFWSKVERYKL